AAHEVDGTAESPRGSSAPSRIRPAPALSPYAPAPHSAYPPNGKTSRVLWEILLRDTAERRSPPFGPIAGSTFAHPLRPDAESVFQCNRAANRSSASPRRRKPVPLPERSLFSHRVPGPRQERAWTLHRQKRQA